MSESNPSAPPTTPAFTAGALINDNWSTAGSVLRMGHWVEVNIYRFPEWRKSDDELSPFAASLPLYNRANSENVQPPGGDNPSVFTLRTSSTPSPAASSTLTGPLTRVSTSKQLGQASGKFSITSKVSANWQGSEQATDANAPLGGDNSIHKYVEVGDWVEIVVYKSDPRVEDQPARTAMVGKVDAVELSIRDPLSGGSTVVIKGRDVGAVYEDTIVYFNPYDPLHSNPEGVDMANIITDVSGSPDEIVESILDLADEPSALFGVFPQVPDAGLWRDAQAGTVAWGEVVKKEFKKTRGIVFDPTLLTPGQNTSLWDFAQTYGVPELNEIYVDTPFDELGPNTGDGQSRKAYVKMYEKPFVNLENGVYSQWFSILPTVVSLQEIVSASLTRSGARINYLSVMVELPATLGADKIIFCPPTADITSIQRYGLQKLELSLNLHSVSRTEESVAAAGPIRELRNLVLCWNLLSPYYWQGTIVIQGLRADIKIGAKLVVEGAEVPAFRDSPLTAPGADYSSEDYVLKGVHTFFVEAVSHDWSAGVTPTCTTRVTVSRGYKDEERLPHMQILFDRWRDATDIAEGLPSDPPAPSTDGALP